MAIRVIFAKISIGILAFGFIFGLEVYAALVNDGILIQTEGDGRVFYVENGKKRWIESAELFRVHGFNWGAIQKITSQELAQYSDGQSINTTSFIVFPSEKNNLPDLSPFALYDLRFAERHGRTILKFSSTYWNHGKAPLELFGDSETSNISGDVNRDVFQRIMRPDKTERHKIVGNFVWHAEHSHYHYIDFAKYIFEPLDPNSKVSVINEKATRCLWDTEVFNPNLPNTPREKVFNTCKNKERQGVSIGWGDTYDYTLADQYLDVHDMPSGLYKISLVIDPLNKFVETRKDNNTSVIILNLDIQNRKIEIIASGAPFSGTKNYFPDNMLVRADGDDKVYVINKNRKRWIKNPQIFLSYGYLWDEIRTLPRGIADLIPLNNIITADGENMYALNDFGYKRRLKNSETLSFYGVSKNDAVIINQTELTSYPDSRIVREDSSGNFYRIGEAALEPVISPIVIFGFTWDEVHTINRQEFESYF